MASRLFWHVPAWKENTPGTNPTHIFDGSGNLVIPLLETESASDSIAPDNYWVERIVGQYQFVANNTAGAVLPGFAHHRVYVMPADEFGVDTRDLLTADDADTSWLMHKVEYYDDANNLVLKGNWTELESLTLRSPVTTNGGFDIKVGRKVSAGEALIWHTQLAAGGFPPAATSGINMWCRVLVKQLG